MQFLKKLFNFYINSSIHVAFSCFALVKLTQFMFSITCDNSVSNFAFFGTIVGYNFVKYDTLARLKKRQMRNELKLIALLSFLSFLATGFYFFQLQKNTQFIGFIFLILTLLYTLPFFPNRRNARNWAGIKIYIVALCWVGVTVVIPIIDAEIAITSNFYLKCLQRFLLIFVLILIFEIIDLKTDDPHLQTVPQKIGVKQTKILGIILLCIFCVLEIFNINFNQNSNFQIFPVKLIFAIVIAIVISIFLLLSNERKSKYYTSFWVESIPVFWWILVLIFS
jgi:hypothetical protein